MKIDSTIFEQHANITHTDTVLQPQAIILKKSFLEAKSLTQLPYLLGPLRMREFMPAVATV